MFEDLFKTPILGLGKNSSVTTVRQREVCLGFFATFPPADRIPSFATWVYPDDDDGMWYASTEKPRFNPPDNYTLEEEKTSWKERRFERLKNYAKHVGKNINGFELKEWEM